VPRRWPRIDLALRVHVRFVDLDEAAESQTVDISRSGLFVRMSPPEPIGTNVRLEVHLGSGERFEVHGVVVRTMPDPDDPTPNPHAPAGVGVFLTAPGEDWIRFVEALEQKREDRSAG